MTAAARRHTAGHTEDRRGASGARTQQTHRTSHGDTAGDTRQPRNTQQTAGAEDKRREGKEGRIEEHGWPRAWGSGGGGERRGDTAAGREQGESRQIEKSM